MAGVSLAVGWKEGERERERERERKRAGVKKESQGVLMQPCQKQLSLEGRPQRATREQTPATTHTVNTLNANAASVCVCVCVCV